MTWLAEKITHSEWLIARTNLNPLKSDNKIEASLSEIMKNLDQKNQVLPLYIVIDLTIDVSTPSLQQ